MEEKVDVDVVNDGGSMLRSSICIGVDHIWPKIDETMPTSAASCTSETSCWALDFT